MVIFSFSYTWQVCFPFVLWESVEKLAWTDQRLGRRGGGVIPDWQSFFALVYTSSRVIPPPPLAWVKTCSGGAPPWSLLQEVPLSLPGN